MMTKIQMCFAIILYRFILLLFFRVSEARRKKSSVLLKVYPPAIHGLLEFDPAFWRGNHKTFHESLRISEFMDHGFHSYMSHGQYSRKMVDGHPIHNKDPKIMVIINPYEPLDD